MGGAIYQTYDDIPNEILLGNLLFMSTVPMKIPKTDLKNIFIANGIPESFVREISAADAFRRATSSVQGRFGSWKVEVDEVKSDKDGIKKTVGIKTVNANDTINYLPVLDIIFNRASEDAATLKYNVNIQYLQCATEVDAIEKQILDNFNEWKVYHTKETIVNTIKRIVQSMHPVNLMPTGLCKFIPKRYNDMLKGLRESLGQMDAYRDDMNSANLCEIIPVIDTEEQRSYIAKTCESEVKTELFSTILEMKDALKNKGSLTARSVASYVERFKVLSDKVDDYQQMLGAYKDALKMQIIQAVKDVNDAYNGNASSNIHVTDDTDEA